MPAERFFLDAPLKNPLFLEGGEFHHLSHVMRLKEGEEVEVVNGKGGLAKAFVKKLDRHKAELEVIECHTENPAPIALILAVPLMRSAKMELVVEKCVEIGVGRFLFFTAKFSEKKELSEHQILRLRNVAISSMKQCGRLDLPSFEIYDWEKLFTLSLPLFYGDPRAEKNFSKNFEPGIFVTGPEKGFSEDEMEDLKEKAEAIRLTKYVLRAETAPIVAAAICSLFQ